MTFFKIKTVVKTVCKGEDEPDCNNFKNKVNLGYDVTNCPECQGNVEVEKDEQWNITAIALCSVLCLGIVFSLFWLIKILIASVPISKLAPISSQPILTQSEKPTQLEILTPQPTLTQSEKPTPLPIPQQLPLIKPQSTIKSLDISPDGQILVGGTQDGKISVWDTKTGQIRFHLPGHDQPISAITISANAQLIISASEDGTIKIWDLKIGKELYELIEKTSSNKNHRPITSLAISEDGQILVTGGQDSQVNLWNLIDRKKTETLKVETGVESLAISKDAKLIVSGNYRGKINIWKMNNGRYEGRTIESTGKEAHSVATSSNGDKFVSSSCRDRIRVWNSNTWEDKPLTSELVGDICLVAISNDAKIVAGLSVDKTIKLWNLEAAKELYSFAVSKDDHQLSTDTKDVRSFAFSSDGRTIAASFGQTIQVWYLPSY